MMGDNHNMDDKYQTLNFYFIVGCSCACLLGIWAAIVWDTSIYFPISILLLVLVGYTVYIRRESEHERSAATLPIFKPIPGYGSLGERPDYSRASSAGTLSERNSDTCRQEMLALKETNLRLESELAELRKAATKCYNKHKETSEIVGFGADLPRIGKNDRGWENFGNAGAPWWAACKAVTEKIEEIQGVQRKIRELREEIDGHFWESCG